MTCHKLGMVSYSTTNCHPDPNPNFSNISNINMEIPSKSIKNDHISFLSFTTKIDVNLLEIS